MYIHFQSPFSKGAKHFSYPLEAYQKTVLSHLQNSVQCLCLSLTAGFVAPKRVSVGSKEVLPKAPCLELPQLLPAWSVTSPCTGLRVILFCVAAASAMSHSGATPLSSAGALLPWSYEFLVETYRDGKALGVQPASHFHYTSVIPTSQQFRSVHHSNGGSWLKPQRKFGDVTVVDLALLRMFQEADL